VPVLGDFSEIFIAYASFTSKRAGEIAAPNTKIPVKARATNFEVRPILLPILVSMIMNKESNMNKKHYVGLFIVEITGDKYE
jgi:hypothetical protein